MKNKLARLSQIVLIVLVSVQAFSEDKEIDIYLNNMEGQIESFQFKDKKEANSYHTKNILSDLYFEKSAYSGNIQDNKLAIELATTAIQILESSDEFEKNDKLINLYIKRAYQQTSLHQFNQSETDLKKALSLGAKHSQVEAIQFDLEWNRGNYNKALKFAHEQLEKKRNRSNLIKMAGYNFQLGKFKLADQYFNEAKLLKGDKNYFNPVQRAWLDVQIGINYTMMAKSKNAETAFRSAVEQAPHFVMALEHLAEFLDENGKTDEAIQIYENIVKESDDPEFIGQLAKLYRKKNKLKEADQLAQKAKEKFNLLLIEFPEAMYWHAANFFLEEGRAPEVALDLLKKNIELRPNSSSYLALAKVQLQLNLKEQAKISITNVLKMPPISAEICNLAKNLLEKKNSLYARKCTAK